MESLAAKRRKRPPTSPQDEALPRRLYEACQRLAPIEPALEWAGRLTPWDALPAWSRRLLAATSEVGRRPGADGGTDEETVAESRALVEEWIAIDAEDVDLLREALVHLIAERLHARDTWIARLTAALAPGRDR